MPREGHKFSSWSIRSLSTHFNPHTPRGARQRDVDFGVIPKTFQSTCPARGTTDCSCGYVVLRRISIHVPREGHDRSKMSVPPLTTRFQSTCPARGTTVFARRLCIRGKEISIHVPREGHDSVQSPRLTHPSGFQSTCPARGTTSRECRRLGQTLDFNPRAPRGARRAENVGYWGRLWISIHVPREGHDITAVRFMATLAISIHVPREGHDKKRRNLHIIPSNFNPRAPRGARL